jgi:hypothetical protein
MTNLKKMNSGVSGAKALMSAALALPLVTGVVHAETAPEQSTISYKSLDYEDSQPGVDRVAVKAHAVQITTPINSQWSLNATVVNDAVSGASPAYHTEGITQLHDYRRGRTVGATRYLSDGTLALSYAHSKESDYLSESVSGTWTHYIDETKNTALSAGVAVTSDVIQVDHGASPEQRKHINELLLGVTQVFGPNDLVQLNVRGSWGNGYYTDPYKYQDNRPNGRDAHTEMVRWNHFFEGLDGTARLSYRHYADSFGVKSHTLETVYVQRLSHGWSVAPLMRLYTQTAANFYVPYNPGPFGTTDPAPGAVHYSEDQRLSAFGSVTLGVTVSKEITPDLSVDVKVEKARQRSNWAAGGDPALAPFDMHSVQLGVNYRF